MDNMNHLNEEQFQKNNKKVKIAGVIAILIGICMILVGFFVIKVPQMNEEGWFEASTKSSMFKFGGFFLTFVGCVIRFMVANLRGINAYMAQQQMPIVQEEVEKMAPSVGKVAKEVKKGINEADNESEK